jgi:hypothetical protein
MKQKHFSHLTKRAGSVLRLFRRYDELFQGDWPQQNGMFLGRRLPFRGKPIYEISFAAREWLAQRGELRRARVVMQTHCEDFGDALEEQPLVRLKALIAEIDHALEEPPSQRALDVFVSTVSDTIIPTAASYFEALPGRLTALQHGQTADSTESPIDEEALQAIGDSLHDTDALFFCLSELSLLSGNLGPQMHLKWKRILEATYLNSDYCDALNRDFGNEVSLLCRSFISRSFLPRFALSGDALADWGPLTRDVYHWWFLSHDFSGSQMNKSNPELESQLDQLLGDFREEILATILLEILAEFNLAPDRTLLTREKAGFITSNSPRMVTIIPGDEATHCECVAVVVSRGVRELPRRLQEAANYSASCDKSNRCPCKRIIFFTDYWDDRLFNRQFLPLFQHFNRERGLLFALIHKSGPDLKFRRIVG